MATTKLRSTARKSTLIRWISVVALVSIAVFVASRQSSESTDKLLENSRKSFQRNQFEEALQFTRTILKREPDNSDARWIAGRSCRRLKQYPEAVHELNQISLDSPHGVDARLLAAEILHYHQYRFDEAEQAYRTVLQQDPMNPTANDGLARLLAVCGRRSEALPMILLLVKQQRASDLLMVLARESGSINDAELLERAHLAAPDSAGPLLGLARLADLKQQTSEAVALCRQAVQKSPHLVAAHVELGKYLLQLNQFEERNIWRANLPPDSVSSAEIQKLIGFIELHRGHSSAALKAFLAAAQSAPDSRDLCYQISRLLLAAGDSAAAQLYVEQLENIRRLHDAQDRVLFLSEQPDEPSLIEMIAAYERCERLLEAYGWTQMACDRFPQNAVLQQMKLRLATETELLSPELVHQTANPAFELALNHYDFSKNPVTGTGEPTTTEIIGNPQTGISFSEDSTALGLSFRYENGRTLKRRMFEFNGGGVGAEDLDRDGFPDIVFSQGGDWELRGTAENTRDVVFRNVRGMMFDDVSNVSSFGGTDYAQGVAIGDIDQDGFPDILVAGIGCARLWMNHGDGTFRDLGPCPISHQSADPWLTSCAIADLNQDSLPDIYLAGYLSGLDVFDRVCRDSEGAPEACLPTVFKGETDDLLLNDGCGGFVNASSRLPGSAKEGKGLGVLVFDPEGHGKAGIYVANDTTPNSLLALDATSGLWSDNAFASGVAVSGLGKSEGSMGIALGDADANGIPDLVVTNFLTEASAFYRGLGNSNYRDDRQISGLQEPSLSVLGFGTQFLDANLDGNLELFVSNGHIDDLRHHGKPYQMPAQLFTIQAGHFRLLERGHLGSYFGKNHLGRAVAKIDWNVDGKPDLILGNLQEPSVILTNTSQPSGKPLQLQLISPRSNREAVCASVTCQTGTRRQVQQLTAGDGYQSSNEKLFTFGALGTDTADVLSVQWPSGSVQEFVNVPFSNRFAIIEGRGRLFALPN